MPVDKKRFKQLMYELRRDKLVQEDKKSGRYSITTVGRRWLKSFVEKPTTDYAPGPAERATVTVISYDIPESMRIFRDWLRYVLLHQLGMKQVHQSVYIGKIKLPEELVKDIVRYELDEHIEIFEMTKSGTLRQRNL